MIAAWTERPGDQAPRTAVERVLPGAAIASVENRGIVRCLFTASIASQAPSPQEREGQFLAFDGWIDEAAHEIVAPGTDADIYAEYLACFGDRADERMCGTYATACWEADGTLRLSRSPWRAPPLHFAVTPQGPVAASLLRVLFALGAEPSLDHDRLAHALWFDGAREGGNDWYRGIRHVPSGSIVRIAPDGRVDIRRWYDPHAIAPHRSRSPDEWVEEGRHLLTRAAQRAAAASARPALSLSSGLDSSLAGDALVRAGTRPIALTLAPDPAWKGESDAATFSGELDAARAFASARDLDHRALHMESWDEGLREFFRASDMATPFIANAPAQIAIARAARAEGCDWLFDATIGNDTVSAQGHWAYAEYLRRGRWSQLASALAARPDDERSMMRKFLALALAPLLPRSLSNRVRSRLTRRPAFYTNASFLRQEIVAARGFAERAEARGESDPPRIWSRRELIDFAYAASDAGQADFDLGLERMTGVRRRDVLAYRPLIEFALSLPSEAFLRNGTDRWLARELARGIMPEDQRMNPRMAAHHVDRHMRLSRAVPELKEWAGRLADHPVMGELVDTARLQRTLANWPENAPADRASRFVLHHGIPNVVALGRFVAHVERRNDL